MEKKLLIADGWKEVREGVYRCVQCDTRVSDPRVLSAPCAHPNLPIPQ